MRLNIRIKMSHPSSNDKQCRHRMSLGKAIAHVSINCKEVSKFKLAADAFERYPLYGYVVLRMEVTQRKAYDVFIIKENGNDKVFFPVSDFVFINRIIISTTDFKNYQTLRFDHKEVLVSSCLYFISFFFFLSFFSLGCNISTRYY